MEQEQAAKTVINRISDELHNRWKELKWDLPESVGKEEIIHEGVKLHAQIQLLYRIIHEIEWEKKK